MGDIKEGGRRAGLGPGFNDAACQPYAKGSAK